MHISIKAIPRLLQVTYWVSGPSAFECMAGSSSDDNSAALQILLRWPRETVASSADIVGPLVLRSKHSSAASPALATPMRDSPRARIL